MSIKRSQNYLYFQNKASHYHNIQSAKTKVQDHINPNLRNTIDHSQRIYDRDFPYLKKYSIDQQNRNFADRLLSINGHIKKQGDIFGNYCRFNKFQRNFRKLNSYKDQQQRKIMIQNDKIKKKLQSTRARVGNHSVWQSQYRDNSKFKKNLCRYQQNQKSKNQLIIQKQRYLPDHYLKFLQKLNHSSSDKSINDKLQGSRTSRGQSKTYRIDPEKMFVLPVVQNQFIEKQKNNQENNKQINYQTLSQSTLKVAPSIT